MGSAIGPTPGDFSLAVKKLAEEQNPAKTASRLHRTATPNIGTSNNSLKERKRGNQHGHVMALEQDMSEERRTPAITTRMREKIPFGCSLTCA